MLQRDDVASAEVAEGQMASDAVHVNNGAQEIEGRMLLCQEKILKVGEVSRMQKDFQRSRP